MNERLSIDEITALLLDEHQARYDGSIPPKALHKILYFAAQEFERAHVDAEIPIYWYMYGAVLKTNDTSIGVVETARGQRITTSASIADIEASDLTIRRGRQALKGSLERYYQSGLEPLTDQMYKQAPYDVQRTYRELDKQLTVACDDEQMTLFGRHNIPRTRETLYDFIEAFPVDEFPGYKTDLHIWYRLVSAELDSDDYEPTRAHQLAKKFWRLFCLELACRENTGLTRSAIAADISVESVDAEKQRLRDDFLRLERLKARQNSRSSTLAKRAAEAAVLPMIEFDVVAN
jgi:hypothetical protein